VDIVAWAMGTSALHAARNPLGWNIDSIIKTPYCAAWRTALKISKENGRCRK